MEDTTNYYTTKHQEAKNQANQSTFFSHFLYKALIVSLFLVVLPLLPSQAPDFINQTINTRGWEILHLVFVGIAVSYGLFSKRNDENPEKESNISNNVNSKFDIAQSYVSRFLQVSSVFDDETDGDSPSRPDEAKVQTWSNQYFRNEPVVVVEEESSVHDKENRGISSILKEKPLLLPVRSLKSRVIDTDVNETSEEYSAVFSSISRSSSNSSSKRFSGNLGKGFDSQDLEEKLKDSVVLPSPIPWRSRSGRMEMKEEADGPPPYTLPPSMEESELNRSFRGPVARSSHPNSATSSPKVMSPSPSMSSPKKFSSSPSFSSEAQGKSVEDFVRKKSFYRAPPPPPPPPPPLPVIRKASSMKQRSRDIDEDFVGKDFKRSFTNESKDLNRGGSLSMPLSVRTIRNNDSPTETWKDEWFNDGINTKAEKRLKEIEASAMERSGRKAAGLNQSLIKTDRPRGEGVTFVSKPTFMEFPKEKNGEFEDKSVMESDEYSEIEEDDDIAESSSVLGIAANPSSREVTSSTVSDGGPDVDKKADEFIAKFREQIRLQRIESIKRSSAQIRQNITR